MPSLNYSSADFGVRETGESYTVEIPDSTLVTMDTRAGPESLSTNVRSRWERLVYWMAAPKLVGENECRSVNCKSTSYVAG